MTGQDRKQLLSLPDTFRILATLRSARLTVRPRRLCRWGKIYGGVRARGRPTPSPERGRTLKGDVTGKLWLDKQKKQLQRAVLTVPGAEGKSGTVTINVTNIDAPVSVSAPSN